MTISATPTVLDGCLIVRGKGIQVDEHFQIQNLVDDTGFGDSGSDVPVETQVLLLEGVEKTGVHDDDAGTPSSEGTLYILLLPVLEGQFRTSLQGTSENELQLNVESGDPNVQTCQVKEALFVNSGYNPFELMKDSIRILAKHKGTFSHVEDKKVPPHLDWFGWCTWDVFYTRVDPQGIREGLKSLSEGGCPAKFLIIDDGWQETVKVCNQASRHQGEQEVHSDRCRAYRHKSYRVLGGLHPNHESLKKYKPKIEYPVLSPGSQSHMRCGALLSLVRNGCGHEIEFSSKKSPVARVSEDYMPHVPAIQTSHVAAVAFNSFFQGEIAAVDWDMFQSDHVTADFHAAARALGGCAVYVSDKPGEHDFKILKKLVLPDGSILKARYAGRPTRDCLFNDPVTDGKSLLKIWNMNKFSGVLGVFNCQGAGSWNTKIDVGDFKRDTHQDLPLSALRPVSGHISPLDVESLGNVARALYTLPKKGNLKVSLYVLKYEIFTICPIGNYGENFRFSPIGLLDMYNSGGAVESLKHTDDSSGCSVLIQARGYGRFGAYSSTKPRACFVDMTEAAFTYSPDDGLLTVTLPGECSKYKSCTNHAILSCTFSCSFRVCKASLDLEIVSPV
ncbi:UNVERIFIED_CONTAM: putative galactinol--sucrose galactosyltransferase 2 [Sesamum calycinum]|uniref:galactinol--sucrose galactosyltransferase n=1 Tax=Sesamum calycinum TaxID=2727403 RepID=A0AAW2IUN0_9LAMI